MQPPFNTVWGICECGIFGINSSKHFCQCLDGDSLCIHLSSRKLLCKLFVQLYKWKNHFSEMKGDVGMSHHEKEGNKKMPIPRQEIIDNPIPTSLFM